MHQTPIVCLLLLLTCLNTLPLLASASSYVKGTNVDTVAVGYSIESRHVAATREVSFFGRLKNKVGSILFKKPEPDAKKGSGSSILGGISIGFIIVGLLLFMTTSQVAGGAALGLGVLLGIISLATKKRTEAQKKKTGKAVIIILSSIVAGLLIGVVIAYAKWGARGH